jgi:hypothetical protein
VAGCAVGIWILGGVAGAVRPDTTSALVGDRGPSRQPGAVSGGGCQAARQQAALATRTRSTSRRHTKGTPWTDIGRIIPWFAPFPDRPNEGDRRVPFSLSVCSPAIRTDDPAGATECARFHGRTRRDDPGKNRPSAGRRTGDRGRRTARCRPRLLGRRPQRRAHRRALSPGLSAAPAGRSGTRLRQRGRHLRRRDPLHHGGHPARGDVRQRLAGTAGPDPPTRRWLADLCELFHIRLQALVGGGGRHRARRGHRRPGCGHPHGGAGRRRNLGLEGRRGHPGGRRLADVGLRTPARPG